MIATPENDRLANTINHTTKLLLNRLKPSRSTKGFIYIVRCHDFIKVGCASNPKSRIASLQIGNPYLLKTIRIFSVTSMLDAERLIHNYLSPYQIQGEWLKPPEHIILGLYQKSLDGLIKFLIKHTSDPKT